VFIDDVGAETTLVPRQVCRTRSGLGTMVMSSCWSISDFGRRTFWSRIPCVHLAGAGEEEYRLVSGDHDKLPKRCTSSIDAPDIWPMTKRFLGDIRDKNRYTFKMAAMKPTLSLARR
jgi:hypothetical protein